MLMRRRPARGVTLLEVLVALVVASVGLMALASLQARALRHTQLSLRRVQAQMVAEEFLERMRANTLVPSDLDHYVFTQPFATQAGQTPPAPGKSCEGAGVVCSVPEMGAFDLIEVRKLVRNLMGPQSALLARRDSSDTELKTLDLWLAWREPRPADPDAALRSAGECPSELQVDDDVTVRCLRWRGRR